MKSNKQRRAEIVARRRKRAEKAKYVRPRDPRQGMPPVSQTAPCNPSLLAPYNSYGFPKFVRDGYYVDTPFACAHCQKPEIWRATQQKWWFEVAKGHVDTRAKLCNPCRRSERARRTEARRVHLEGLARKQAAKRPPR
jgi:hypothetical protein